MNRGVVASVRDLVPLRPLTYGEHLRIAELQANRFLKLVGVGEAPVPERIITELPRIQVEHMSPFPVSGATHWSSGRWLVVLSGTEPRVRQRFGLAHEFKHIIDHRFAELIYSKLRPGGPQDPHRADLRLLRRLPADASTVAQVHLRRRPATPAVAGPTVRRLAGRLPGPPEPDRHDRPHAALRATDVRLGKASPAQRRH